MKGRKRMEQNEILKISCRAEALKNNLIAIKAALHHGELDCESAESALLVVADGLNNIMYQLLDMGLIRETIDERRTMPV